MMNPWAGWNDNLGMGSYAAGSQGEMDNFMNPAYDFDSLSAGGINYSNTGQELGMMDRLGMKLGLMGKGNGNAGNWQDYAKAGMQAPQLNVAQQLGGLMGMIPTQYGQQQRPQAPMPGYYQKMMGPYR
jgi:hypothetical protein